MTDFPGLTKTSNEAAYKSADSWCDRIGSYETFIGGCELMGCISVHEDSIRKWQFPNRRSPIWTPIYCNPDYGNHPKRYPQFWEASKSCVRHTCFYSHKARRRVWRKSWCWILLPALFCSLRGHGCCCQNYGPLVVTDYIITADM